MSMCAAVPREPGKPLSPRGRQLTHWVTPEAEASIRRNQCLPHKLYPEDVARMMLWLAADDSRSCTAQLWVVDGGWM